MLEMDTQTWILVALSILIIGSLLLYSIALSILEFTRELRYLNSEISRTVGAERMHWIRQRRRLWLSLIPFVRY